MILLEDYKEDGLWVKCRRSSTMYYKTRAFTLWNSMSQRCKVGSSEQRNRPTYAGCSMSDNFKDFQFFAEWCQQQLGYSEKDEKGNRWQLDKDLLVKGNREYSENNCVFLPQAVNTALSYIKRHGTNSFTGVSFCNRSKKFRAYHNVKGKLIHIGYFVDEDSAREAYKNAKEGYIKQLSGTYRSKLDIRALRALETYEV